MSQSLITKELPMLKTIRLFMLVCVLVGIGSTDQNIGDQNIGAWAQAGPDIGAGGDQNI